MSLSDAALDRYARHIVLREIGGAGQLALTRATVAIVGAGGIGAPVLLYLAAAGVGRLRIVDDDEVSLSNLQRQVIYGDTDVGKRKVEVAAALVRRLNADVVAEALTERVSAENVAHLIEGANVVVDGTDNFRARLAVADAAFALRIPLVSAAIGQFHGQLATWRGWLPDAPCYRCYVGDAHDADDCDTCADVGVLGAMTGIMGSYAALEAVRTIYPFGEDPTAKLHIIDGLAPTMRTIRMPKDPGCRTCGTG